TRNGVRTSTSANASKSAFTKIFMKITSGSTCSVSLRTEHLLCLAAKRSPVKMLGHPCPRRLAHVSKLLRIGRQLDYQRRQFQGTIAANHSAGLRDTHRFCCAAGGAGDNGLATGLRFEKDHTKAFDVFADLSVRK